MSYFSLSKHMRYFRNAKYNFPWHLLNFALLGAFFLSLYLSGSTSLAAPNDNSKNSKSSPKKIIYTPYSYSNEPADKTSDTASSVNHVDNVTTSFVWIVLLASNVLLLTLIIASHLNSNRRFFVINRKIDSLERQTNRAKIELQQLKAHHLAPIPTQNKKSQDIEPLLNLDAGPPFIERRLNGSLSVRRANESALLYKDAVDPPPVSSNEIKTRSSYDPVNFNTTPKGSPPPERSSIEVVQLWKYFFQRDRGRYRGSIEALQKELEPKLSHSFKSLVKHPHNDGVAVLQLRLPDGSLVAYGLPLFHTFSNVRQFFTSASTDDSIMFSDICDLEKAAELDPVTLDVLEKGRVLF
jgi:hypothetical protein